MPPAAGIEPDDLVTPKQASELLGVPANRVRVWINRYQIEPLGRIGRWNVYDYRAIARIEAKMAAERQAA